MPPDVPTPITPQTRPPVPPKSDVILSDSFKYRHLRRMEITFTRKRLIHSLVFVLACMSIFRLIRFAATTYKSSSPYSTWAEFSKACNLSDSRCREVSNRATSSYPKSKPITKKEFRFLSSILSKRMPCNLLVFGWEAQYRHLVKMNSAGKTIFLEDTPERIRKLRKANNTRIYKVDYNTKAKEAYKLLKYAREEPACAADVVTAEKKTCQLKLLGMPDDVYRIKWDVILVDGPKSDGPEDPGRMTTIYTANLIARAAENSTMNVVIHDVDRIIEKWYSREFLCEENLVSSKGRFWNFKIKGGERFRSSKFCSQGSPFNK